MADPRVIVCVGSVECVRDGDGDAEFTIVEPHEADAVAERVSAESPLSGGFEAASLPSWWIAWRPPPA